MTSSARAVDTDPPASSPAGPGSAKAKPSAGTAAAARKLSLWWRYRDSDLSIDQSLYLKLPCADERLVVRGPDGSLRALAEGEDPGRDFLVEGRTGLQLGQLARVVSDWLTLSMRRLYVRGPGGEFLELSPEDAKREDALIRRLDRFLSHGDGPYRILAVALRPDAEESR